MKYLALIILLFPGFISACVIGPKKLNASIENGFAYEITVSDLCENCNRIIITAPLQYNDRKFALGVFTLLNKNKILSRSIHSTINELGLPKFASIIHDSKNISYEITFLYGEGNCKAYEFIYKKSST